MQVAEVKMNAWDAREAFALYRKHVGPKSSAEDKLIMESYRQLSRYKRVLDIVETMRLAGLDANWRPKLAICRADQRRVIFEWTWARYMNFSWRGGRSPNSVGVELPSAPLVGWDTLQRMRATAIVPLIPPHIRPKTNLHHYRILWEANWDAPPVDPILLRPIGGNLYVICAQWDLTPLERAVLNGRGR